MSSRVLYPPVLDSYMPAFQAGDSSYCRVYFSLSKFNSSIDFTSLHASIMKQSNGLNVVKPVDDYIDDIMRYRSAGIILNIKPVPIQGEDNLFYFDIYNSDLSSEDNTIGLGYKGWIPGWIYKIQIRLSTVDYDGSIGQAAWLNENANNFSEWSTVCTVKAIGKMDLVIPPMDYNSQNENEINSEDTLHTLYISTLNFFGRIISEDPSEVLYKYSLKIYDADEHLLDDTGELYTNQYQNANEFKYLVKYEFQDGKEYKLIFNYITNNGFEFTYINRFIVSLIQVSLINCSVLTLENDINNIINEYTSYQQEEEEGRICLKLYSNDMGLYNGNVCIRRSSSKSNFKEWVDIKIFNVAQQNLNTLPVFYDYIIESGVWYKYGVQSIDGMGNRGVLNQASNPIMRNFEYSYLLGENNQQLKLMFNNTMPSYKIQLMESKVETIGGEYPIITRNAALNYRIFPINGLISFWMDENKLFTDKLKIYGSDVASLYTEIWEPKPNERFEVQRQYDYTYERDFRQAVLDFLHNGKPKLFKSPTEGNVIVRLTEINCVPNQTTDRMIYEFTSTGNELAENIYDNYIKYNFIDPGEWSPNIYISEMHMGQIQMEFTPTTNVFYEIYKKYDGGNRNYGGYRKTLRSVQNIRITIEDPPLRIKTALSGNAYDLVVGNNIRLNGKLITIYGNQRIYEFDDRLIYTKNDELYFLPDEEGLVQTVKATVDFVYDIQQEVYQEKQRQSVQTITGVGQIYHEFNPGDSIYNEISYKYFIDWDLEFRELNKLTSVEIECNPGAVFSIQDDSDIDPELHEMNETGTLRFYDIDNVRKFNYVGFRDPVTGIIDETKPIDVLINYIYVLSKGTYKGE